MKTYQILRYQKHLKVYKVSLSNFWSRQKCYQMSRVKNISNTDVSKTYQTCIKSLVQYWSAQKCIKCHEWEMYQILMNQKHTKVYEISCPMQLKTVSNVTNEKNVSHPDNDKQCIIYIAQQYLINLLMNTQITNCIRTTTFLTEIVFELWPQMVAHRNMRDTTGSTAALK